MALPAISGPSSLHLNLHHSGLAAGLGMTIVSVRLQFGLRNKRKELRLRYIYGGFEAWFPSRLKPIREALRGPEAKGLDIVNFWLYESLDGVSHKHEWWRCMNTFQYDFVYDLDSMLQGDHISNLRRVMQRCVAPMILPPALPSIHRFSIDQSGPSPSSPPPPRDVTYTREHFPQ
jgi:hypothetical protein